MRFLEAMHLHGGRHVKRLGPSVGPIVWKISRLPGIQWWPRYSRQMGFKYKGRHYKGRYAHTGGGRLEIVRVLGMRDGPMVAIIDSLDTAMTLNLQASLDRLLESLKKIVVEAVKKNRFD